MNDDFATVWQTLQDAMIFYERHASSGAVQARKALTALERLRARLESSAERVNPARAYRMNRGLFGRRRRSAG